MFKKILASVSSVSLALGIAALTSIVGPVASASATGGSHSPAGAGETCVEFASADLAGATTVSKGAISATISSPDGTVTNWSVSSSSAPLATIEVNSNNTWSDRTGQASFSGDSGSPIVGAWVCTAAAVAPPTTAPVAPPIAAAVAPVSVAPATPYVLVAWLMPAQPVNSQTPTWDPYQSFFAKADLATKGLNALDSQLTKCGTSYQVDLYNDSATTTSLINGGKLYAPGHPTEDFPSPMGWGVTYKLINNPACQPRDAAASVSVSAPTCRRDGAGIATFSLTFASWADTTGSEDQTVGAHTRTANAQAGHLFSNGLATMDVSYTIPGKLDSTSADCYKPVPVLPSYNPIRDCGVYGSITLENTAYVTYAITHGDGKQGLNTVVATPVSPYVFGIYTTYSWVIDLGTYTDCYTPKVDTYLAPECTWDTNTMTSVKQLTVTFNNTGSTVPVTFSIPSAGITEVVGAGLTGQATIAIGAVGSEQIKVYADGRLIRTIQKFDGFLGCEPLILVANPTTAGTCNPNGSVANGTVNVDWMPTKVTYTITGDVGSGVNQVATGASTSLPPGHYTVSASALPGYVLSGTSSWDATIVDPSPCVVPCQQELGLPAPADGAIDCDPPTLGTWQTAAYPTQPTCSARNGSVTVGDVGGGVSFFTGKVDYFLDGSVTPMATQTVALAPGSHAITAAPHVLGDGLTGSTSFSITITPSTLVCADLKTLALTGSTPTGWFGLGYGLLAAGMALVAMRILRRRRGLNG